MRFFASAAALPSAAAIGLARDANRGCCSGARPFATATSSAQLKANMIFAFVLAQITATRGLSLSRLPSHYGVPSLLASSPSGQYESVVTVHEAASLSTALAKKTYV